MVISFRGNPQNIHPTDELRNLEEQSLEEKLKLEGLCFWRSRENWELEAICILVNLELGDHVCEGRAARGGKLRLGEIRRS